MLFVVAVIFLGAALLAVTGNGGLAMPPVKPVNCALPGSRVLGPQGAQFHGSAASTHGVARLG